MRSRGSSILLAMAVCASACANGLAPPPLVDMNACFTGDAAHCIVVDDAGVSHGCGAGGRGPGDRDDGGGAPPAGPPDQGADLRDQPLGATCLFNEQCASNLCFYFRVKGQICTRFCTCNADCPPPSLGCGGMGVCRAGN